MNILLQHVRRFLEDNRGPTATEYGVLIAVICVAVIGALSAFGIHMDNLYAALSTTLEVWN